MAAGGLIGRIIRHYSPQTRRRGRVLQRFANKLNLVYFGMVDQHEDDHEVIRGLTVSTTHRDNHYTVGVYDGYDVSVVDRFDIIVDPKGNDSEHTWLILQIDLEQAEDFPHIFLKPVNYAATAYSRFFTAFGHLQPINSMFRDNHSSEFHGRYELYAASTHALEVEELLNATVTQTIAARLWPHAVEVMGGKLYFYITEAQLSEKLLESALDSALWLARIVDNLEEN